MAQSTIKIAHISDVHYRGSQRHEEYAEVMNRLYDQLRGDYRPNVIFIGGDIVHSKVQNITPEVISILRDWFENLASIAPVVVMLGNHDGLVDNPDRLDTITPVVQGIDNVVVFRDSGAYDRLVWCDDGTARDVRWCIYSPFDEKSGGWDRLRDVAHPEGTITIAGYHGIVNGSESDSGMKLDGGISIDEFSRYDFTMLGDIHAHQTLGPKAPNGLRRVVYPGSLIQQNYGESTTKGWVFWEIRDRDDFKYQFVRVHNDRPFITVEWDKDPSTSIDSALSLNGLDVLPPESRVRFSRKADQPSTLRESVEEALRGLGHKGPFTSKVQNPNLNFSRVLAEHAVETTSASLDMNDIKTFRELYQTWLGLGGVKPYTSDATVDSINEEIEQVMAKLSGILGEVALERDRTRAVSWRLDRIEWDNIFAYGTDNVIDFGSPDSSTIHGIFGPNGIGKSTVVAVIMYALFNGSDRGSLSSVQMINDAETWCEARAFLTVDAKSYQVVRRTERTDKTGRNGEVKTTVKNSLDLKVLKDDQWIDLAGEKRDTEKAIRDLIGTADDFRTVSLSPQGKALEFIESGKSERRNTILKLLDLDFIDDLLEKSRKASSLVRSQYATLPGSESLGGQIQEAEQKLSENQDQHDHLESEIERLEGEIHALRSSHALGMGNKAKEIRAKIQKIQGDIKKEEIQANTLAVKIRNHQEATERAAKDMIDDSTKEDLLSRREACSQRIQSASQARARIKELQQNMARNNRSIQALDGIPCGTQFPSCPYIKDAFVARDENETIRAAIDAIGDVLDTTEDAKEISRIDNLVSADRHARTSLDRIEDLSGLQASLEVCQKAIECLCGTLATLEGELEETLSDEIRDTETSQAIRALESQVATVRSSMSKVQQANGMLNYQIESARKGIDEAVIREAEVRRWSSLMEFLSPKGLINMVIRRQIPVINDFISNALGDDLGFGVTVDLPEDSKSVDIFLHWPGRPPRPVETTSGMQKFITAIAIRSALHSVTGLPKSDLMILDEGFGALDSDNLQACFGMINLYRTVYKSIVLISHIDTVKEHVDVPHTVTVEPNGYSRIWR